MVDEATTEHGVGAGGAPEPCQAAGRTQLAGG